MWQQKWCCNIDSVGGKACSLYALLWLNLAVASTLKRSDVCSDALDMAFDINKLI